MTIHQGAAGFLRSTGLLITSCWLLWIGIRNEIPADSGDGLMHFFYAQASWQNPYFFLHHWGKPLFILLSSGFAQFGFTGIIVFNTAIHVGTVWMGYKILNHFECNPWIQGLLPGILLLSNDYVTTIVGGLTEPLFNLALVSAFYLFIKEKYVWFAIMVSFMPFMRSEGQLPVILSFVLLYRKQSFKSLPFLTTGFLIYAVAGVLASKSFWWFFTESPYSMDNSIYGKGTWWHYLLSYKSYLGNPGLFAFILGTISGLTLIRKKDYRTLMLDELLLAYGVFFGVIFAHSYFWATGQNGSLGLTRIATQGMPLFLILQLYLVNSMPWLKEPKKVYFGFGTVVLLLSSITSPHFPVKAGPMEQQLIKAARFMKRETPHHYKVHYHYPLFIFGYGENPFLKDNRVVFSYFSDFYKRIDSEILPGEFVVWDSHFGPQEAGLSLDTLTKYKQFVKVNEYLYTQSDGRQGGVLIYQYVPLSKQTKFPMKGTEIKLLSLSINPTSEFIPVLKRISPSGKSVTVQIDMTSAFEGLYLVYDHNKGEQYSALKLTPGAQQSYCFEWPREGDTDIYLWNPDGKQGKVRFDKVILKEHLYHPVMP
jgi:hypothetical protein